MRNKYVRFRIGLRTLKTVAAVVISMTIVDFYGATASKLIFAMLGAMAVVQPTFKESWDSCLTQIVGVLFGGLAGVFLVALPVSPVVSAGIGIVLVITVYNGLRIQFSPSLPCFIVVMLCTEPDIQPMVYALGRIWDSAIGLGVGMLINTLIFPYDNRRQIHATMESLDGELISFLEDMFDGDNDLPDAENMAKKIDGMKQQLQVFANQKLLMRPSHQRRQLASYREYEDKVCQLVAHMEVLCNMEHLGRLHDESRRRLKECGAAIRDRRGLVGWTDRDVVTNYHVEQILELRQELLDVLRK